MPQCKLCRRETSNSSEDLCVYHSAARNELKRSYQRWCSAYSEMSWMKYLNTVKGLEHTGQWIRDVIAMEEANPAQ